MDTEAHGTSIREGGGVLWSLYGGVRPEAGV